MSSISFKYRLYGIAFSSIITVFLFTGLSSAQTPTSIVISPSSVVVQRDEVVTFEATVLDENNNPMDVAVVWSATPGANAFIIMGMFAALVDSGTIQVKAALSGNESIFAVATVTVSEVPMDGLKAWFRSDKGIVTSSNGRVERWEDQSGNGRHANQANVAGRPTVVSGGYGEQPVLRFNGNQFLDFDAVESSSFTVFLVFRATSLNENRFNWILYGRKDGRDYGYHAGSLDQGAFPAFMAFDGVSAVAPETSPKTGVFHHVVSLNDELHIDHLKAKLAQAIADNATSPGALSKMVLSRMGCHAETGENGFTGEIAEILYYDTRLSVGDQQNISGYLAQKYNVPPVTVVFPNGGESFSPGQQIHIVWSATQTSNVNVFYSTNGGEEWVSLNAELGRGVGPNDPEWGSYSWTIPEGIQSGQCFVRVECYVNSSTFDVSDDAFSIGLSQGVVSHSQKKRYPFDARIHNGRLSLVSSSFTGSIEFFNTRGVLLGRYAITDGHPGYVSVPAHASGPLFVVMKNRENCRIQSVLGIR